MDLLITEPEPDLSSQIEAGYRTTWGEKKAYCKLEARRAYERGETHNGNPYVEDTWPHRWWSQTISDIELGVPEGQEVPNLMLSRIVSSRRSVFNFDEVPQQARCRWFVRRGASTKFERGFRSKIEASNWINSFGVRLGWRAGFAFRLRGDDIDMYIVDRNGNRADAVRIKERLVDRSGILQDLSG